MIKFYESDSKVIFSYSGEYGAEDWVSNLLEENGEVCFKKTFTFKKKDQYINSNDLDDESDLSEAPIEFIFAELNGDYFKVKRNVLTNKNEFYIHSHISLSIDYFVAYSNISILGVIDSLVHEDIYIGGDNSNAIPLNAYKELLSSFPNTYERKKYSQARIASILRNYFDSTEDAERNYNKYMNRKISKKGTNLIASFKATELVKYQMILKKLEEMLRQEVSYNEKQWQEEIVQIIRLLYPKYIAVFKEVPIIDKNIKERFLDFMLIDSSGHADIVEIKRPFENCIITEGKYRDNYIPLRELSGTIMQLEKYIYYLNRWGTEGEKKLSEKYKDELPKGLDIKITNPNGIIIMGRDNKLNTDQKADFEVVKRKYKNVIDIITYDDLIRRLKFTIEQFNKV